MSSSWPRIASLVHARETREQRRHARGRGTRRAPANRARARARSRRPGSPTASPSARERKRLREDARAPSARRGARSRRPSSRRGSGGRCAGARAPRPARPRARDRRARRPRQPATTSAGRSACRRAWSGRATRRHHGSRPRDRSRARAAPHARSQHPKHASTSALTLRRGRARKGFPGSCARGRAGCAGAAELFVLEDISGGAYAAAYRLYAGAGHGRHFVAQSRPPRSRRPRATWASAPPPRSSSACGWCTTRCPSSTSTRSTLDQRARQAPARADPDRGA